MKEGGDGCLYYSKHWEYQDERHHLERKSNKKFNAMRRHKYIEMYALGLPREQKRAAFTPSYRRRKEMVGSKRDSAELVMV